MPDDWTVREYESGDQDRAIGLFNDAFGQRRNAEMHRWKFFDSPFRQDECSIYVAASEERIVGQFGGVAQTLKLGDSELRIMHGCDVVTNAEYRKRGVLASVGKGTFAGWKKAGFDFCVGLENETWGSRIELLNLLPCLNTQSMFFRLRPDVSLARRLKLPRGLSRSLGTLTRILRPSWPSPQADTSVRALACSEPQIDTLWESMRDTVHTAVRRDAKWLAYRYFSAPHADYRILLAETQAAPQGYACYRIREKGGQRTGVVADLFADWRDEKIHDSLIHAMLTDMHDQHVETVAVPLVAHPPTIAAFERFGFVSNPGYRVVAIPLVRPRPEPSMLDAGLWFTMAGDFDIV